MSPKVEGDVREAVGKTISYFAIDLSDSERFNVAMFSGLVGVVSPRSEDNKISFLNFVVASDKMYVFDNEYLQTEFCLAKGMSLGRLQCAGKIQVNHQERRQQISGKPEVFLQTLGLDVEKSDKYKKGFLSDKLKNHFLIS